MPWQKDWLIVHTSGNTALVSGFAADGDIILTTNYGGEIEGSQAYLEELGWSANSKQSCPSCDGGGCDTCDFQGFVLV